MRPLLLGLLLVLLAPAVRADNALQKIPLGQLRLPKKPLEEAVAGYRQLLQGTAAEALTIRFIDHPEQMPGFKPQLNLTTTPPADWRQIKVGGNFSPTDADQLLTNLAMQAGARQELRGREIWIFPDTGTFQKFRTRVFPLPYNFVSPQNVPDVHEFLRRGGVRSYEGTAISYDAKRNRVTATNTPEQLDLIEVLLD